VTVPSVKSLLSFVIMVGLLFGIQDTTMGRPAYRNPAFIAPNLAITECKAMLDTFCNALNSPQNAGKLEVWVDRTNYKIHFGIDPEKEFMRAQVESISSGQAPSDFIQNLERSYLVGMERILKTDDPDEIAKSLPRLQEKYQHAIERTVDDRIRQNPSLTAQKAAADLGVVLHKALWDQNENFLRAQAEFNEVKSIYLSEFANNEDIVLKLRAMELKVPGEISGDMNEACEESVLSAYYNPDKNYMSVCIGLLSSGQSLVQALDQKLSAALNTEPLFSQLIEKRFPSHDKKTLKLRRSFALANDASV
jgi:hypothetical protein